MTASVKRHQMVDRARFLPRTFAGFLSICGYVLLIVGIVLLIAGDLGRWNAVLIVVFGAALMCASGLAIRQKFLADAKAAGFSDTEIRAIEDEAERLNEEED